MFTGIVQDLGKVEFLSFSDNSLRLGISTQLAEKHLARGASVACNGCCLTVVETQKYKDSFLFYVDVGPETLNVTCFSKLKVGTLLNLEPALCAGDPLGGHQVSGHIDTVCEVHEFEATQDGFWKLSLRVKKEFSKWMVPKGSLAVAGVSLTIARITPQGFDTLIVEMMIIPHTYCYTILQFLSPQSKVEVEFDQMVKAIASVVENMVPIYL